MPLRNASQDSALPALPDTRHPIHPYSAGPRTTTHFACSGRWSRRRPSSYPLHAEVLCPVPSISGHRLDCLPARPPRRASGRGLTPKSMCADSASWCKASVRLTEACHVLTVLEQPYWPLFPGREIKTAWRGKRLCGSSMPSAFLPSPQSLVGLIGLKSPKIPRPR